VLGRSRSCCESVGWRLRNCGRADSPINPAVLEAALDAHDIQVHYQPKATRVGPNRWIVEGVEAIARCAHRTLGFISPARFIPLAEKNGLIRRLTEQVLEMSLAQCRVWDAAGLHPSVAIHLPPAL